MRSYYKHEAERRMSNIKKEMRNCILEIAALIFCGIGIAIAIFAVVFIIEINRDLLYTLGGWIIVAPFVGLDLTMMGVFIKKCFNRHAENIGKIAARLTANEKDQVINYINDAVDMRVEEEKKHILDNEKDNQCVLNIIDSYIEKEKIVNA